MESGMAVYAAKPAIPKSRTLVNLLLDCFAIVR